MLRSIEEPPRSQETLESFAEALGSRQLFESTLLAPLSSMPNRDSLAQIADFLLPTEGIDTVIVYGPRRGKIILSARSTDESLHLGRILSEKWSGGLSGGHKALAGGQIPFDVLLSTVPKDPEEAERVAVKAMTSQLEVLFQSEVI